MVNPEQDLQNLWVLSKHLCYFTGGYTLIILKRGWEILKIHGGFLTGIVHRTKWWIFQPRFMTLEGHRRSVGILTGWWCNNHLETYDSQWEGLSHI